MSHVWGYLQIVSLECQKNDYINTKFVTLPEYASYSTH